MIVQFSTIQEIKFLCILCIVIAGWQASALFFYNYFKLKDENVKLNKILLSYGFLVLMTMLSLLFLTIVTLIAGDSDFSEVLRKGSYVSAIGALAFFWFYISGKEFADILNPIISKLFMLISVGLIIFLVFLNTTSSEFRYLMVILVIESVFLVAFQIKLILKTSGILKKRIILITISGILMVISMALGADTAIHVLEIPIELYDTLFFESFFFLLVAIVLLFIALYNFPPIFEFKWKDSLLKLIIFNHESRNSLYSYDFPRISELLKTTSENDKIKDQKDVITLFSGGIIGIDGIISAITNTEKEKLNKIKQGGSFIFLEYGTNFERLPLSYALVVKEDLKSIRYFLKTLREQFESFYKEILFEMDMGTEYFGQLFGSFEIIIKNLLAVG